MRRIKHRIGAFLLAMLVCLSLVIPVYADTEGFAEEYYRLNDMAELLSDNEDQELQTRLDEVSQRQKFDVTITTTWDLEGFSVKDYADTFYENCKFGYGSNHDGIMLLISMEDRVILQQKVTGFRHLRMPGSIISSIRLHRIFLMKIMPRHFRPL